jgi:hypothetical protein
MSIINSQAANHSLNVDDQQQSSKPQFGCRLSTAKQQTTEC